MNEHGFVEYRRREFNPSTGQPWMHIKRIRGTHGARDVPFRNCDIAPYNRFLTAKYGNHINVEVVNKINAVKYLFDYIYKVLSLYTSS